MAVAAKVNALLDIAQANLGDAAGTYVAQDTAAALISETLMRGARDNVSVVVVDCTAIPQSDEDGD